jgi:hypothetical protein
MPEQRRSSTLRILLDENVDRLIKSHFHSDFEVTTVPEQGWAGLADREVLRQADDQFDVFVTMDQNLPYQQNLSEFEVAVVVLKAPRNAFSDVVELMPTVNEQVRRATAGEATVVDANP